MDAHASDTVIWFGGEVKALDDNGRIGGYLVRFSTSDDPDLVGDFFTRETDFGPITSSPILYDHGLDPTIKSRRLGLSDLKIDDVGVWIEGQMNRRDQYEQAIFEMAKQGKLGWSSGTAAHLVEREAVGKSFHVKSWPLGLDASLTPTPCEPRTKAIPLKSLGGRVSPLAEFTSAETEQPETPAQGVAQPVDEGNEAVNEVKKTAIMENQTNTGAEHVEVQNATTTTPPVKSQAEPFGLQSQVGISVEDYIRYQRLQEQAKAFSQEPQRVVKGATDISAPHLNLQTGTGDSYTKAFAHYMRTADAGGLKSYQAAHNGDRIWEGVPKEAISIKASNATDLNITTAADGGDLVPVDHFNQIIARRDESDLTTMLGVRRIPGRGTTVDVPVDDEADGEFVSTSEGSGFDLDAPAFAKRSMTLVKYTKEIRMSIELMEDEDSQLLSFLANFVGRGAAKTRNNLLLTEVATNGTSFLTFNTNAAIADGELEEIEDDDDLGGYLDDGGSVAWVMRNSTLGAIRRITASGPRPYQVISSDGPGIRTQRELLGYPVFRSNKAAAIATVAKTVYFGNWFYVGVRDEPEFRVLRDPYSNASTGQVSFWYYMRVVYSALQPEAIGYGEHPV